MSAPQALRFVTIALFLLAAQATAQLPAPERPSGWTDKSPVVGRRFMVAAANPLACIANAQCSAPTKARITMP